MKQRPDRAHAELPFEPEPDINRYTGHRRKQRAHTRTKQFFRHLTGYRIHAVNTDVGVASFQGFGDLCRHGVGELRILVCAIRQFHADRNLIFSAKTLNGRIAIAELRNRFAQFSDRCGCALRKCRADHLAADKIDAKVQALCGHQANRRNHEQQADAKGPGAPFQKVDIGIVRNEFEQFHVYILKSSAHGDACASPSVRPTCG